MEMAVIIAGGRGTRLAPVTCNTPKPLVDVNGLPFIHYLIRQAEAAGLKKALILAGYLGEQFQVFVEKYAKDFPKIDITVHISDPELNTGARLLAAAHLLEENFLFLYGDNYAPIDLTAYLQRYEADSLTSRVLVYENYDGYSRSNVLIKTDFSVSAYGVKVPSDHPTQLVDIGYVLMNKTELADFRFSPELHFGKDILVPIIERGRLVADIVRAKYFTVGTMSRLQATRAFFKGDKYIFLDRDGVLNEKAPRGEYVLNYNQFIWRKGAIEGLKILKELGFKCILITNQAGIGRGLMSESELNDIHIKMCVDARRNGGEISYIYYCPHHWEDECDCRKPKPGMLLQAQKELLFDVSKTYFIGDDDRDGEAAKSAGAKFIKCEENMDLASIVSANFLSQYSKEFQ